MLSILVIHMYMSTRLPEYSTLDAQQKVCQLELKDDFLKDAETEIKDRSGKSPKIIFILETSKQNQSILMSYIRDQNFWVIEPGLKSRAWGSKSYSTVISPN